MMQALLKALTAHLESFHPPLYLADSVPQAQGFPYLTAQVTAPLTPHEKGGITLTLWCTGNAVNNARVLLHGALMQYFPHRGCCLDTAEGRFLLQPETARCVREGEVYGIETALNVHFYPAEKGG